jgi:hypothetical protein
MVTIITKTRKSCNGPLLPKFGVNEIIRKVINNNYWRE